MRYKLVEENNESYIDGKEELHNLEEITRGIRTTLELAGWGSVVLLIVLLIFVTIITIGILGSVILNFEGLGHAVPAILISLLLMAAIAALAKAINRGFSWRKGKRISDKQLVENVLAQGEVASGTITKVSDGVLHYQFEVGDLHFERQFLTDKWEKFNEGDKVAVLHVYAFASCLL